MTNICLERQQVEHSVTSNIPSWHLEAGRVMPNGGPVGRRIEYCVPLTLDVHPVVFRIMTYVCPGGTGIEQSVTRNTAE